MLYSFNKYKIYHKPYVDLEHKKNKFLSLSCHYIKIKYSSFFRKLFFRTLLLYINLLNCNFFYPIEQNFFYFTAFMHANYSIQHPSFYYDHTYTYV